MSDNYITVPPDVAIFINVTHNIAVGIANQSGCIPDIADDIAVFVNNYSGRGHPADELAVFVINISVSGEITDNIAVGVINLFAVNGYIIVLQGFGDADQFSVGIKNISVFAQAADNLTVMTTQISV